jgi:hypothetical protein
MRPQILGVRPRKPCVCCVGRSSDESDDSFFYFLSQRRERSYEREEVAAGVTFVTHFFLKLDLRPPALRTPRDAGFSAPAFSHAGEERSGEECSNYEWDAPAPDRIS